MKKLITLVVLLCLTTLISCKDQSKDQKIVELERKCDTLSKQNDSLFQENNSLKNEINNIKGDIGKISNDKRKYVTHEEFKNFENNVSELSHSQTTIINKYYNTEDNKNDLLKLLDIEYQKNKIINEEREGKNIISLNERVRDYFELLDHLDFINFFSEFQKKLLLTQEDNFYNEAIKDYIDNDNADFNAGKREGSYFNRNARQSILSQIQADCKAICKIRLDNNYNHKNRDIKKQYSLEHKIDDFYGGRVYELYYKYERENDEGTNIIVFTKINDAWKIIDFIQRSDRISSGK